MIFGVGLVGGTRGGGPTWTRAFGWRDDAPTSTNRFAEVSDMQVNPAPCSLKASSNHIRLLEFLQNLHINLFWINLGWNTNRGSTRINLWNIDTTLRSCWSVHIFQILGFLGLSWWKAIVNFPPLKFQAKFRNCTEMNQNYSLGTPSAGVRLLN